MPRLVLSVLVLSALASAALIGWLFFAPDALKPLARLLTERITGYELTISGELHATFSLQPTIVATGVSLSNATWAQDPELIAADLIRVQVDLPGLLEKRIELLELFAQDARGALEVTVDGASNLSFLIDEDDEAGDRPWQFIIQGLVLDNVRIIARIGEIPPITLEIVEVVEVTDPASYLNFTGSGELNDNPWRLTGKVGTLADIMALEDVQVDLDLDLDDVLVAADGTIGRLTRLDSLDLDYEMHGDDASVWGDLLGVPELFDGKVSLTGRIEPAGQGLAFSTRGNIAAYQVDASGTVQDASRLDGIDLSFALNGPDVSVFGLLLLVEDIPHSPFTISGRLRAEGTTFTLSDLLAETEFLTVSGNLDLNEFPELDSGRGSLHFAGSNAAVLGKLLALPDLLPLPFDGGMELDGADGRTNIELSFGNSTLLAQGRLGRLPDLAGTHLTVSASGDDLTDIVRSLGSSQQINSRFAAAGQLQIQQDHLTLSDGHYEVGSVSGSYSVTVPLAPGAAVRIGAALETASLQDTGQLFAVNALPDWPAKGSFDLSRDGGDFQLQSAEFAIGELGLSASGSLGDLSGLDQLALSFTLSGPSTNALVPDIIREEEDYPFIISGKFSSNENLLLFDPVRYSAAETVIDGSLTLPVGRSIAGLTAKFKGQGPSLRTLYPGNEGYRPADAVFRIDGAIHLARVDLIEFRHIDLSVNELHMFIDGFLDLSGQIETDLEISLQSNSMQDIGMINNRNLPDLPFQLRTSLHGDASGLDISSLQLNWADNDISGSGSVRFEDVPWVTFRGQSNRLGLVTLQEALLEFDDEQEDAAEENLLKVFPDEPISLENLTDFNADVDVVVKEFTTRLLSFDEVSTSLVLEGGTLQVDEFEFRDDVGNFSATGKLEPVDGKFSFAARIHGEDADLGLFTSPDQPLETVPRYTLDIDLSGRGSSIAEVMGSLDGTLLVHSEGGRIDNDLIDTLGGDFLGNVLGTLFPFEEPLPYTQMECLVFKGRSSDGVLSFKPGFTARTAKVNAFVLGKVDLRSEQLQLSFATQARSGIGISASSVLTPYFLIGGTMANPVLELDTANAAIAYSLAAGTGGLSILIQGFLDRIRGEQNPCEDYLRLEF